MAETPEFKYLAIKNWDRFQSAYTRAWVRDYTAKEDDEDYVKLSCYQRYILDGCRRLRGRTGKNIPNDATYIARALHTLPTDRPHLRHAIDTLVVHGLLLLTNEQDSFQRLSLIEKKRVEDSKELVQEEVSPKRKVKKLQAIGPETSSGLKAVMLLPLNSGEEFEIHEDEIKKWKGFYPAVDILQELRGMAAWLHSNPTKRKTRNGIKAFINRWLSKAQDNPKGAALFRQNATGAPPRGRDAIADLESQIGGKPQ